MTLGREFNMTMDSAGSVRIEPRGAQLRPVGYAPRCCTSPLDRDSLWQFNPPVRCVVRSKQPRFAIPRPWLRVEAMFDVTWGAVNG